MSPRLDILAREYDLLTQHFIYQNTHRLRELTTFLVLEAGIAALLTGKATPPTDVMLYTLAAVGCIVAALFYLLIRGSSRYIRIRIKQAISVEAAIQEELKETGHGHAAKATPTIFGGFRQVKARKQKFFSCETACYGVILLTLVAWLLVVLYEQGTLQKFLLVVDSWLR